MVRKRIFYIYCAVALIKNVDSVTFGSTRARIKLNTAVVVYKILKLSRRDVYVVFNSDYIQANIYMSRKEIFQFNHPYMSEGSTS